MSGFFYIGTGAIMFGCIWTTLTGEFKTSLLWTIWGASLIIKDAIENLKDVD